MPQQYLELAGGPGAGVGRSMMGKEGVIDVWSQYNTGSLSQSVDVVAKIHGAGSSKASSSNGPAGYKSTYNDSMYEAFRQSIKTLKNAALALNNFGAPLAVVLSIIDVTLDMVDDVQLNNATVTHICTRMRNTTPVLNKLKDIAGRVAAQSDEMAGHVINTIEAVGNIMIDIHRIVSNWSQGTKANMITRFLASNSYKQDFLELNTRLSNTLQDCNLVLTAAGYVDRSYGAAGKDKATREAAAAKEAEEAAKEAIKQDMQNLVRDILDAEAAVGESRDEWTRKAQMYYKSYGLDFKKLKKNESKRWRAEKLRDLAISFKDVELHRQLGSGGSGVVYEASWQGVQVAVKLFQVSDDNRTLLRKEVENEGYIMSTLRHPNVAQFYGIILDEHYCGLVVEKYKCSLDTLLHASNMVLTPLQSVELALQIANGLAYLHGRRLEPVVHGDLKPSNVLITEDFRAVITDFGLARVTSSGGATTTYAGGTTLLDNNRASLTSHMSMVYTAPEVLLDCTYSMKRKLPSDVFSFGVVLYELLVQRRAYMRFSTTDDYVNFIKAGSRPPIPQQLPGGLRELITRCWAQDPEQRPTFSDVVATLKVVLESVHALNLKSHP